jgi:hypothetical protein
MNKGLVFVSGATGQMYRLVALTPARESVGYF